MNSLVKSQNFLIKYLVLELFEKLHRLKKYIDTCEEFDKKNNNKRIVKLFNSSIEIIGNEILTDCSVINNELSETDKFAFLLRINQHSRAIVKIHEELSNLHSCWILPEIKTFTNEIVREKFDKSKEINIILSDHYSFLERNLGRKFDSLLQKQYGSTDYSEILKENHSFILPKIEFSNPLNWTIIVHEAGHLNRDVIEKIKADPSIMPDGIQSISDKTIKNWAEEIYCDIYATSILGPSYFMSFVSFALLSSIDYGISSFSELHPSVLVRASIIITYLKNNDLLFDPEWGIQDYTKIFYDGLIDQHNILKDESGETIEGLTKFNRNLRKLIKELDLNKFKIDKDNSKQINQLLENLKIGIPIGSVSNSNEHLANNLDNGDITIADIEKIKESVSERASDIWEILNSGWIYKLETSCAKGDSIFFTDPGETSVLEKIRKYGEVIDFLDDRLLASINTSQIVQIIEAK